MDNERIKVGITHGDINGVGYEIILKTLEDPRISEMCTPVVYGSVKIASFYRKLMELPEVKFTRIDSADQACDPDRNYIINVVGEDVVPEPGQRSSTAGQAALASLERAVADLKEGLIDVLVTCPISKDAIHGEEFAFPGHTEYLEAKLAGDDGSSGRRAMMIMAGEGLRVALVTIHDALSEVTPKITAATVADSLRRFSDSLTRDFGVHAPRIAVLSVDPHAGDNGVIGETDRDVIAPAIAEFNKKYPRAFGPFPADGFFASGSWKKFDGVLAMYHDQGLIPFKLLIGERGVNFTAGLDAVRTSPDHGTAFDIAGKGVADPQSLREAIYMALDICRNRQHEDHATANPLRKQTPERSRDKEKAE